MHLVGCGILTSRAPKEGQTSYLYADVSGQYQLQRGTKKVKNKSITRSILVTTSGGSKIVEKNIAVSQLGTIKGKKGRIMVMRPEASDFVVWLEGKKYESKMRVNTKKKSMVVNMESPEPKWKGVQEVPFPTGSQFCFFSQIPECLYHTQMLNKALNTPQQNLGFYVVWDSFPYTQEQFAGAGKDLFAPAVMRFEATDRGLLRFIVEVNGQIILYHFSKSFDLVKISWIAQGITIVPVGEVIESMEE